MVCWTKLWATYSYFSQVVSQVDTELHMQSIYTSFQPCQAVSPPSQRSTIADRRGPDQRSVSLQPFVCFMFNGASTQEGPFVLTARGWNRLGRITMANKTRCIILNTLHNYNVTQLTVKHPSYKTATAGDIIVRLTYLYDDVSAFADI